MKLLLDTCTFLWYVTASEKLSSAAKEAIENPDNELFLSVASAWEISVKYAKGRLALTESPGTFVPKYRELAHIATLELREDAALLAAVLPHYHNDPFDRILICQAVVHRLAIVSPDPLIAQYRATMLW
ncbi:MAG TPA: type II toxin-antitoxin system VapC family toxin [Bryobacteraceae bacterium]|nr:type II toxin-antitoxin system VapC family toxin [Bryobacteraceae bacterium]